MGNKSVIHNGINGYVCESAKDYATAIRNAMKKFPVELTDNAYNDVISIYNTDIMKKRYIKFYNEI